MTLFPYFSIWERYIYRNIFKVFFLCLFGFYSLYVLINYSSHSHSFHHYHFSFTSILIYYLNDFVARLDFLVPFALIIACTHTLCDLNIHNELTALLMAGITYRRILKPFFFSALFCMLILYANAEIAAPIAAKHYREYEQIRSRHKHSKRDHPHIQQIGLMDQTSLVFQKYNNRDGTFEDAYWIRSIDDLYRMKSLKPIPGAPFAVGVERLQRDLSGALVVTEQFTTLFLPELQFNKEDLLDTITEPQGYALSELHKKSVYQAEIASEKEAKFVTTYYLKLAMPFAALLAVLIPAPLALRFTRTLPKFFIYATSIFSLVFFFLVLNAAALLGERQVLSPAIAVWTPCLFFFLVALIRIFPLLGNAQGNQS